MPCETQLRRTCRPQPSLAARLNCKPCNRAAFFVLGVGIGMLMVRGKSSGGQDAKKDKGKDKG
ncbi:CG12902, partial [Drosophila busckii]